MRVEDSAAVRAVTSPWAPFAHRAFTVLFIAQFVSNIGTWMHTVGAQWYLVEESGSPALVAWVTTATTLPVLFLSLFAGVAADLLNRRRLLLWTTVAAAVFAGGLTAVAWLGALNPLLLLAATFLLGCTAAIIGPAWQAIQPELVQRHELPTAASLATVTVNGARAIGPAIAGLIVATSGPAAVFAINTLSFFVVAAALVWWRREPQPVTVAERALPALLAGGRYVRSAPSVQKVLWRSFLFTLPASALWALLPTAANQLMDAGASGYSLLLALMGLGAVAGVFVMPGLRGRLSNDLLMVLASALFAAGTFAAALLPFVGAAAGAIVAGMGWIIALTSVNAGMQLLLPGWVRARGMSVYLLVFMGSQAVGSFAWGVVSELIGVQATLVLNGVLLLLTAATIRWWPMPTTIGQIDRTIVPLAEGGGGWAASADELSEPLEVHVRYVVPAAEEEAFLHQLESVRRTRARTGAVGWRLLVVDQVPAGTVYLEVFDLASAGEHQLQHTDRVTQHDADLIAAAKSYSVEEVSVRHYRIIR